MSVVFFFKFFVEHSLLFFPPLLLISNFQISVLFLKFVAVVVVCNSVNFISTEEEEEGEGGRKGGREEEGGCDVESACELTFELVYDVVAEGRRRANMKSELKRNVEPRKRTVGVN